ncbi:MAG TPA: hypothetical protein VG328_25770 [Stellaceae bacterium]|nr:hypothetical protein [Stellaceae bacterium]
MIIVVRFAYHRSMRKFSRAMTVSDASRSHATHRVAPNSNHRIGRIFPSFAMIEGSPRCFACACLFAARDNAQTRMNYGVLMRGLFFRSRMTRAARCRSSMKNRMKIIRCKSTRVPNAEMKNARQILPRDVSPKMLAGLPLSFSSLGSSPAMGRG